MTTKLQRITILLSGSAGLVRNLSPTIKARKGPFLFDLKLVACSNLNMELTAKLIKTYESDHEYESERELIKKGLAFDEFDNHLRTLIKYDSYKPLLASLKLEHKITIQAAEDLTLKLL